MSFIAVSIFLIREVFQIIYMASCEHVNFLALLLVYHPFSFVLSSFHFKFLSVCGKYCYVCHVFVILACASGQYCMLVICIETSHI